MAQVHSITRPLRLWINMPKGVLMAAAVTSPDHSINHLNAEIAVCRKDFNPGHITSLHVMESIFGEYKVRVIFPKECLVSVNNDRVTSADAELENFMGKRAFVFVPPWSVKNHLVLLVMENGNNYSEISGAFKKEISRGLDGLLLAFTP